MSRAARISVIQQKTAPVLKMAYNTFQFVKDAMVLGCYNSVNEVEDVAEGINHGNMFDHLF